MRIVYFGNNDIGLKVLRWLLDQKEEIAALVVHPREKGKRVQEMLSLIKSKSCRVFEATMLAAPSGVAEIKSLKPDMGISVSYGYILKKAVLDIFPRQCINLHPGLLPYNKGAYPNVWSLVDGTPAGVTLHYVDAGVDTGDVIAQKEVPKKPWDTGETLYRRLEAESFRLFQETWPSLRAGSAPRIPQRGAGTFHRVKDVDSIDGIDLARSYAAKDLINVLRARTFPPYSGAYFTDNGQKIYMRLQLSRNPNFEEKDGNVEID